MRTPIKYDISEKELTIDTTAKKELKDIISAVLKDVKTGNYNATVVTLNFTKHNKTLEKNILSLFSEFHFMQQAMVGTNAYLIVPNIETEDESLLAHNALKDTFLDRFVEENKHADNIQTKINVGLAMPEKDLEIDPVHAKPFNMSLDSILSRYTSHRDYLHDRIYNERRANLDGDVDFQRDYVWTLEQKQQLIYSILNEMPIGNFYINAFNVYSVAKELGVTTQELSNLNDVLYDGKQRISTIVSFMLNEFPVVINGEDYFFGNLSPKLKNRFYSTNVTVYETSFTNRNDLIDYYVRINTSQTRHSTDDIQRAISLKD